jgi:hypothetical protein
MSQSNHFSSIIEARRRQILDGADMAPAPPVIRPTTGKWPNRLMMAGALIGAVAAIYVGRLLAGSLSLD